MNKWIPILSWTVFVVLLFIGGNGLAQTTYVWNGGSTGDFQVAINWTPTRNTPNTSDILNFSSNATINNVTSQTIARLQLSNNANVTLGAGSPSTRIIISNLSNPGVPVLNIPLGCSLHLGIGSDIADSIAIAFSGSNTASIAGSLFLDSTFTGTYNNSFYTANSQTTVTGSGVVTNGGNIISTSSTLIFQSGSTYIHNHIETASQYFPSTSFANANVVIQGYAGSTIGNIQYLPISMSNFTVNCPNLTTGRVQFNYLVSGNTVNIANNMTVTMGSVTNFFHYAQNIVANFNIGRNLYINNASVNISRASYPASWTVADSIVINNGGFQIISGNQTSGRGAYNLTVKNYYQTGSNSSVVLNNAANAGNTVADTANLIIKGNFTKLQGNFITGFQAAATTGAVSSIKFMGTSSQIFTTDAYFNTNASTFLEIANTGAANNNTVTLGNNVTDSGILKLTSGRLVLGGYNFTLTNSTNLLPTTPTSNCYIDASGGGGFTCNKVGSSTTIFPVGTAASYTPLVFFNTTNTPNITVLSVTPSTVSINKLVNLQWVIQSSISSTSNVAFQYNTSNIGSGFTVPDAVLAVGTGTTFTKNFLTSISGSNPFIANALSAIALSSTSPAIYAIGDSTAFSSIPVPGTPIVGSATVVNGNVDVSFSPPLANSNFIGIYTVVSNPSGIAAYGASSPIHVNGLQNGTNYTFSVLASNVVGNNDTASIPSNAVKAGIQYYLSSSIGNDSNTILQAQNPATPWKTLDKLNSMMGILLPGNQVLFNRNDTFPGTLVIDASGIAGNPIVFSAYGVGNKPVFDGRLTLPIWNNVGTNLWEASNASLTSMPAALFINDTLKPLGRYPNITAANRGYLNIDSVPTGSNAQFSCNALTGTPDFSGAMAVVRSSQWSLDKMPGVVQSGKNISFASPSTQASYTIPKNFGFFFQNHPNCLDIDGDWCYQDANDSILLYATKDPNTRNVKVANTLISITDSANAYTVIDNIAFIGSSSKAISLKSASNCTISNCDFTNSGKNDINMSGDSINIINNTFSNTQGTGIYNSASRVSINGNTLTNISTVPGMGESGQAYYGLSMHGHDGILIQNNVINGTGYCGIGWGGSNVLINKNVISNFCSVINDGGGIYTWDNGGDSVSNRVISNNIVMNGIGITLGLPLVNYNPTSGIYLDYIAPNTLVTGNTVANCSAYGIMLNGGSSNTVTNNTVYNCNLDGLKLHQSQTNYTMDANLENLPNYSTNNDIQNNTIVSTVVTPTNGYSIMSFLATNPIDAAVYPAAFGNYGTIDNNIYCNPFEPYSQMQVQTTSSTLVGQTLSGWTNALGYDINSTTAPVTYPLFSSLIGNNGIANGSTFSSTSGWTATAGSGNSVSMAVVAGKLDGNCLSLKASGSNSTSVSTVKYALPAIISGNSYVVGLSVLGTKTGIVNCYLSSGSSYNIPINISTSRLDQQLLFLANSSTSSASLTISFTNADSTFYVDNITFFQAIPSNPDNYVRFAYNPTSYDSVIVADKNYITPSGLTYSLGSTVLLPSYGSVVLLKDTTVNNFYYVGSGNLNNTANWGNNSNGSGSHPSNFTSSNQLFIINNTISVSLSSNWTVSGTGSMITLGDGSSPIALTIPNNYTITGTVNISNNATLINQNTINPTIRTIAPSSTLVFNGNSQQTIPAGIYGNITINNSAGTILGGNVSTKNILNVLVGSLTTGNNNLTLGDSAFFAPTSKLNISGGITDFAGNPARFQSSSLGTAAISSIVGTLINANKVTVERFISSKTVRKYSIIGSPVSQAIADAWQQQIYITGSGYGGSVCGATSGRGVLSTDRFNSNGFDITQFNMPSMFTYNVSPKSGSRWVTVANTTQTNLTPGVGYKLNIRGNRNSTTVSCNNQLDALNPAMPESVTLNTTGTLTQGDLSISLNDSTIHKYTLLANPYQSPISFTAFQASNASNINNKMWTYSPFGNGNYTTYSQGIIVNGATNYDNSNGDYLAVGQGFFVESNANGNVTFHESHKTNGVIPNTQYFGSTVSPYIRIGLKSSMDSSLLDEIVVRFNANGTPSYNYSNDAISFDTGSQVLVSIKNNSRLAIATHPVVKMLDTTKLGISSKSVGAYSLSISQSSIDTSLSVQLIDNFLGKNQEMKINKMYGFNITSDTGSMGDNRFLLVTGNKTILPIGFSHISATKKNEGVFISWQFANKVAVSSFTLERSIDGNTFTPIKILNENETNEDAAFDNQLPSNVHLIFYRVKATNKNGDETYSPLANYTIDNTPIGILNIYPNPTNNDKVSLSVNDLSIGSYRVAIFNGLGQQVMSQNIRHNSVQKQYKLNLHGCEAGGVYRILLLSIPDNRILGETNLLLIR